jgi:mRNA interferase MazF
VVVVQTNLLNKAHHPSTLVCPVTTHIEPKASLLRVNMKQGTAGLEEPSSVMIDQLRAIDNARLVHKVGKLPSPVVEKLKQNIMLVMDLW